MIGEIREPVPGPLPSCHPMMLHPSHPEGNTMKQIKLLVIAAACCLPLSLAHAADPAGKYKVKGKDASGAAYEGKLAIVADAAIYRLTYKDGKTQRGAGILRDDNLFAAWGPSDKCSISALEVKADGSMEGPWADVGHNKLGSETFKRQSGPKGEVAGSYSSSGIDPEGNSYSGMATIEKRGALYKVTYKSGGETFLGVGATFGKYLAISYGGPKCGLTAYSQKGNNLSGVFAQYNDTSAGTEEAIKE
jgi:hypothetical protein